MQTTLLGLAIAFIIAIVSALVGPSFIDWSQFRPRFEAEASRVLGTTVRVSGDLDARLLPSPSLRLDSVVIGGANDKARIQAQKLNVEFSLGSLMRGEWRATELTLNGISADVGLDARGRLELPLAGSDLNLSAFAIDRLNITGRIALHNAARRATVELNDIAFSGDVRSFPGSIRGSGNFMVEGLRYPFRLSTGSAPDNVGTRLHLAVEQGGSGISAEADGVVVVDRQMPRFDGSLTLARTQPKGKAGDATPWKITTRTKADHEIARFEQLEISYGVGESAIKLTGAADMRYGVTQALRAALSARQFDADKFIGRSGSDNPESLLTELGKFIGGLPPATIPARVELAADQIMLGGRAIQKLELDVRGERDAWTVQRLDLRAPGATRVTANGVVRYADKISSFSGPVSVESTDPDTLTAWLQGRTEVNFRNQKPLRVRGTMDIAPDRLAIANMAAEVDGSSLTGHLRMDAKAAGGGIQFDAGLKAERLDLDAFAEFVRSLGGAKQELPTAARLSLDIEQAISAGQTMRPFIAELGYDPAAFRLERIRIGDATNLMLDGSGAFNRKDATGALELNGRSASLAALADIIRPFAPDAVARMQPLAALPGAADMQMKIELGRQETNKQHALAKVGFTLGSPQLDAKFNLVAQPGVSALQLFDLAAIIQANLELNASVESGDSHALLEVASLAGTVAAGPGRARLQLDAQGSLHKPIRVTTKVSGAELDAEAVGSIDISGDLPKGDVQLNVRKANIAPLLATSGGLPIQPATLSTRIQLAGGQVSFTNIDSLISGSRVRGRLAMKTAPERIFSGALGTDTVEIVPVIAAMLGLPAGNDTSAPLGRGAGTGWRGEVAFQVLRAGLPGGLEINSLGGQLVGVNDGLILRRLTGKFAGGNVAGELEMRQQSDGHALHLHLDATDMSGALLRYGQIQLPAGAVSLKLSLNGKARSAAALFGGLAGEGTLSIRDAKIDGLDETVFAKATKASDESRIIGADAVLKFVTEQISKGSLQVASMQVPFTVNDGRAKVNSVAVDAEKTRLTLSGGYDLPDHQFELRASLSDKTATTSSVPEIILFMSGSPQKVDRVLDVSNLATWLGWRNIERETRRLEALQRDEPSAAPEQAHASPPNAAKPADDDARKEAALTAGGAETASPAKPPAASTAKPGGEGPVDAQKPPPRITEPASSDAATSGDVDPIVNPPLPQPHPRRLSAEQGAFEKRGESAAGPAQVAPLPAPIEVLPAPGDGRSPRPRPQAPLVIAPARPGNAPQSSF